MTTTDEMTPRPAKTINLETTDLTEIRLVLHILLEAQKNGPKSRERSLMVTKLEEARMWAGEGMMRE